MLIIPEQRIQIARNGGGGMVTRVPIDPLTSDIVLRIWRGAGFLNDARISTRLIVRAGAADYIATGSVTGGVRDSDYMLRWHLPTGHWNSDSVTRLGERAGTFDLLVELMLNGSAVDSRWSVETLQAAKPNWTIPHRSVVFDAATDAVETSGDGVLSLSHTAAGSGRAAFAGVTASNVAGSTSVTYAGNSMTEQWDLTAASCGYTIIGDASIPASSQTVTSTLDASTPNTHILSVVTLTGVDTGTPLGTAQTTSTSGTSITVTCTSLSSDGLIVDHVGSFNNPPRTHTEGANQTLRTDEAGNNRTGSTSTQSSNDGGVMSWTTSDTAFIDMGAIEFKPAAAGAFSGLAAIRQNYVNMGYS